MAAYIFWCILEITTSHIYTWYSQSPTDRYVIGKFAAVICSISRFRNRVRGARLQLPGYPDPVSNSI